MADLALFSLIGTNIVPKAVPGKSNDQPQLPLSDALELLSQTKGTLDVCELCGGVGRTTRLAVRRRLAAGRNFDLQTGVNLDSPSEQASVLSYLDTHQVFVVVMSPSCRSTGPPSSLNRQINYDTWEAHYNEDRPHIESVSYTHLTLPTICSV